MTTSQAIVRLASILAGGAILVTLGWSMLAVADCRANVGNGVDWCGLAGIGGLLICVGIGAAWLVVMVAVVVGRWIAGRFGG